MNTGQIIRWMSQASCAALAICLAVAASPAVAKPFSTVSMMPGFRVVTSDDGAMRATDLVVVEFTGTIAAPMADDFRALWEEIRRDERFARVAVRLNSPGGSDIEGKAAIAVLAEIRAEKELATIVGEGDTCASMCIALYVQGETRYASPASSWMFHGATRATTNIPSLPLTASYFDRFRERGIDAAFIDYLYAEDYVTTPGAYWMSGRELADQSNIITDLLPNWRPQAPNPGRANVIRGGI